MFRSLCSRWTACRLLLHPVHRHNRHAPEIFSAAPRLQPFHSRPHNGTTSRAGREYESGNARASSSNRSVKQNRHRPPTRNEERNQLWQRSNRLRSAAMRENAHTITGARDTKKRKVAFVVGYCGTGYRGLQYDPKASHETIEGVLFDALYRAGFILKSNYSGGDLRKIGWDRGSRTDKGVHSLCTVISAKLEFSEEQLRSFDSDPTGTEVAALINRELPSNIRVFSVQHLHRSFDARNDLQWRRYRYVIPVDALKDGEDSIPKLNEQLSYFRGTKMFHNFTVSSRQLLGSGSGNLWRQEAADESTRMPDTFLDEESNLVKVTRKDDNILFMRNVYHVKCEEVTTDPVTGKRFGVVELVGASFVRHQIRKMIGTAICVVNGILPDDYIHLAIESDIKMPTPLAPSEGLYLYSAQPRARSQGDMIDLREDMLLARIQEFQSSVLIPHISDLLQNRNVFEEFLESVQSKSPIPQERFDVIRTEAQKFIDWRKAKRAEKVVRWQKFAEMKLRTTPIHKMDIHQLLPPGFSTELCLRHNILPGPDLSNALLALRDMMIRKEIMPHQATFEYYFDVIDRVGFDVVCIRGEEVRINGHDIPKLHEDMEDVPFGKTKGRKTRWTSYQMSQILGEK